MNSPFLELFLAYSITLNSSNVDKCFWSWILKDSIKVQKKKKKGEVVVFFVFPSSIKRENRMFHVVVVQPRLRNVQKSFQSCCFANLTLLLFFSVLVIMDDGDTLFPFVVVFFPLVIYCTNCTSDHKLMEVNFQ